MKIAFLGGTRFIGLAAVRHAVRRGHSVVVLHRDIHNAKLPPEVEQVVVDREDAYALTAAVKAADVTTLVDTFAMDEAQTKRTIDAIDGAIESVVVLSSQDVYAQFGRLNGHRFEEIEEVVKEDSSLTVRFPFKGVAEHEGGPTYDKKDVERLFKAASALTFESVTVLRLPAVYGTNDDQRRMGGVIDALSREERLPHQEGARWRWTMSHVENVAHAIVLAAERSLPGFNGFNVGEAETPTFYERVVSVASFMGTEPRWHASESLEKRFSVLGKMPNDFVVDSSKIREDLGFEEVVSTEAGYRDLIDWCQQTRSRGT
jgi:nucleoside-diphosphate-sugar epimerase